MREARIHGGALDAAIARHGGARGDWLDLSTGISPAAPPLPPVPHEALARLPERHDEARLREAARAFYGAPDAAALVAAPGTQSLISLWPHLFAPTQAAVLGPTYAEHGAALRAAGHAVAEIASPGEVPPQARLVVIVNPNNPDGRRLARAELRPLAGRLAAGGGLLVVDEAFMDADPEESLAGDAGAPGLLVLRSFGKFFGLAGLRLGFALSEAALAARLAARLGPWPVSGPALAIGTALMGDPAGVARQRAAIHAQNALLLGALAGNGLTVEGATPLFALVRDPRAPALFEALARRRILTRPFADRPDRLRFGNPAGQAEADRLAEALALSLVEGEA